MKKNHYRALSFKKADLELLAQSLPEEVTFGVDVAKKTMFATLMDSNAELLTVLKWENLSESRQVVAWLSRLPKVSAVMEPSGTYGDPLRCCLESAGVPVYRVSPKQVKDMREVYDGVPSNHDAKSSAIVAWLHHLGRSDRWRTSTDRRSLAAAVSQLDLHDSSFGSAQNRLEAQLARYWPEVTKYLDLDSATLLELLGQFGSPSAITEEGEEAEELMRRVGGARLSEDKIQAVLDSAEETVGVSMVEGEVETLQDLALEARRRQKQVQASKRRIKKLNHQAETTVRLSSQVGQVTAAILVRDLGPLEGYTSAGSLLKAAGLNLKEVSSGRRQGQLAITKRGPRRTRQYLYLAVLRWVQKDPWALAWYNQKVKRDGGEMKIRGLVALMRKLLQGLWWVARGERFESQKLFDTRRLAAAQT